MGEGMTEGETTERGRFLVLDGIDGCGKSTQARLLVEALSGAGPTPLHLREPGSTPAGEQIRSLLLDPDTPLAAATEALLFCAARRQMLDTLVTPALQDGRTVVCERFHPATFAYQAVGGGLDQEELLALLHGWSGEPVPDRILLLDLDPAAAAERTGAEPDRFESRGLEFQRRVREGFLRYAELDQCVVVIDASGETGDVAARIMQEVGL